MKTLTDEFAKHLGEYEYNAFVRKIITWFYGEPLKYAWCAISMSYMANQMGILDQFGGKNQNVYEMLKDVTAAVKKTGKGKLTMRANLKKGQVIKRGTVMFMLNDTPPMHVKSSKHVTTCYKDFEYKGTGTYQSLGGNQRVEVEEKGKTVERDGIYIKPYAQSRIYAIFEPDYGPDDKPHPTLRRGDKGADVKTMQKALRKIGFGLISGEEMVVDGSFGRITQSTVVAFQTLTGLKQDGICGPKTWAKIDEMLIAEPVKTTTLTALYKRIGPGPGFKSLGVIDEGVGVTMTTLLDGWAYIPAKTCWVKSKWLKL